ncbi:MAG: hypothetical protein HYZ26_01980 [Chloroflexi bacterium]|nr:hypothetical protein [Chloroflexota bacterium]
MQTFYDTLIANPDEEAPAWPLQAAGLSLEQARALEGDLADWQSWWVEKQD